MKKLLIHHHLGLGDHFVCNGLVRKLYSTSEQKIVLVVKKHNLCTVKALYRDLDIEFQAVDSDSDVNAGGYDLLKIGFEKCVLPYWEKSFYDQLGYDYSVRYDSCFIDRDLDREADLIKKINPAKNYAFCNKMCSNGRVDVAFNTSLPMIELSKITDNMLDWVGIIMAAKEIHTVDSSVVHLIKNVRPEGEKFFYNARGTLVKIDDGTHWNIIN